ncbi:MAG: metallophosphatase family protein, partial [Anaerolineae bacterium]|nr:metallophosphatase family protein [Anaerolineae bacterium]
MLDQFAVIADIHGNTWALDAVLADIRRRGIETIFNLGDSVFNCLDPAGTAARLMAVGTSLISIAGNQERDVFAPSDGMRASRDYAFVSAELSAAQVDWLRNCPPTYLVDDIFLCHGTPESDETYLLETVTEGGVFLSDTWTILSRLGNVDARLILCGHSHVPRVVWLPGNRLVVNPGSVGIPAYDDDLPFPHIMESGSPHAR